jgi:hypothetical protein
MRSIKQSIRTNQALMVIQRSTEGMSIVKACQKAGIPRSTFYYFCVHHPDAIASFQELRQTANRQQFELLLENQFEILEHIVEEGLAANTSPRHRLAIYKFLTKRMDELFEDLHINAGGDKGAADFLTGPKLERAVSRFSASESEINLP